MNILGEHTHNMLWHCCGWISFYWQAHVLISNIALRRLSTLHNIWCNNIFIAKKNTTVYIRKIIYNIAISLSCVHLKILINKSIKCNVCINISWKIPLISIAFPAYLSCNLRTKFSCLYNFRLDHLFSLVYLLTTRTSIKYLRVFFNYKTFLSILHGLRT